MAVCAYSTFRSNQTSFIDYIQNCIAELKAIFLVQHQHLVTVLTPMYTEAKPSE